jgi:serine/threonine protein kinase
MWVMPLAYRIGGVFFLFCLFCLGGMAQVWMGEWHDRTVAVKRLRNNLADMGDQALDEFAREIQFMQTARHRNIIFFFGAGVDNQRPFVVLEFMARGSLFRLLRQPQDESERSLSLARKAGFALDAARGVQFLHHLKPPVVHRDLKCANLLVSSNFVVKLADFGGSRFAAIRRQHQHQHQDQAGSARSERMMATSFGHVTRRVPPGSSTSNPRDTASAASGNEQQMAMLSGFVGTTRWNSPELITGNGECASCFFLLMVVSC